MIARAVAAVLALAALAAAAAGVWAWGYQVGEARADVRHARAETVAVNAAHTEYAAQVELGNRAALRATERALNAEQALGQVKQEVRHVPVTVFVRAPAPSCPGADELRLTAGAVRLWNSALAGADVAAGACGVAGAPAGACAAGSDITVTAAHANAVENGTRFQRCHAQLNELLDLLDAQDARAATSSSASTPAVKETLP